jgi:hypothetical protein
VEEWGRSGLTDVGEDLCDGFGLGEERDEREGSLAGGTDQRQSPTSQGEQSWGYYGERKIGYAAA